MMIWVKASPELKAEDSNGSTGNYGKTSVYAV
jgi:hypothetical protein